MVGDSVATKHSEGIEHTAAMDEASPFDCTAIAVRIVAAAQTVVVAMMV